MKASHPEPEIVTRKGKPVSVILPIKHYQELLERVEDAEDVAWLNKVRRKQLEYRSLEDCLTKHYQPEIPAEPGSDLIELAGQVYEGLSDKEVEEVESLAKDRNKVFR